MNIILRLVCENFSSIAVKISFLLGPKHGVYAAASFSANVTSWYSHKDTQIFTSVILYMNIFITQWLFGGNSEILHCFNVFAGRRKLCKPESIFKQTHDNFYTAKIWRHFQLRHSYAKGPFWVTWLKYYFHKPISEISKVSEMPAKLTKLKCVCQIFRNCQANGKCTTMTMSWSFGLIKNRICELMNPTDRVSIESLRLTK